MQLTLLQVKPGIGKEGIAADVIPVQVGDDGMLHRLRVHLDLVQHFRRMAHQGPTALLAHIFMITKVDDDRLVAIGRHPQIVAHANRSIRGIVEEVVGSRGIPLAVIERIDFVGFHEVSASLLSPHPAPLPGGEGTTNLG